MANAKQTSTQPKQPAKAQPAKKARMAVNPTLRGNPSYNPAQPPTVQAAVAAYPAGNNTTPTGIAAPYTGPAGTVCLVHGPRRRYFVYINGKPAGYITAKTPSNAHARMVAAAQGGGIKVHNMQANSTLSTQLLQ